MLSRSFPLVCLPLLALAACGDDSSAAATTDNDEEGISASDGSESGTTDASETGTDTDSSASTTLPGDGDGDEGPECFNNFDCPDGVCIDEMCCALDSACVDECCGAGEVCLFDSCTQPGSPCTTADDCGEGEYCELGLGEPSPGPGLPPEGLMCLDDLPPSGACVPLPVICTGAPDDPEDCVPQCEYMPPAGQLAATVEWQWGLYEPIGEKTDLWATPSVARIYDANCDGKLDTNDPPNVAFVAGDSELTCCSCGGVNRCITGELNLIDGRDGTQIWRNSEPEPGSVGWAGMSVALGDVDGDDWPDVVAMTGEGKIALVNSNGVVTRISDQPVGDIGASFGWGGGIAMADMDHDGHPEIAFARTLFTTTGGTITRAWVGAGGSGRELSHMVDVDGNGIMELLAGNTAYNLDGSILWQSQAPDGFTAVADLDQDGTVEIIVVRGGVYVLDAATGEIELGPVAIPSEATRGGPPTVADFDGDGRPEIGIAGGTFYVVYEHDLTIKWQHGTKDTSSAVTGSSVFDFEGDGFAEVVYSDECFLRVLDGQTGELRFAAPNTTFTATEALIVADVDGDESAEIVRVSNSANWSCNTEPWISGDPDTGLPPWTPASDEQVYYRGLSVFGAVDRSWVGTRAIWNQHAYNVTNVCSGTDSACSDPNIYGSIPVFEQPNFLLPWLNNFRQNVMDEGVFNAPNATVDLDVECSNPMVVRVSVRNAGLAPLPAGVAVEVRRLDTNAVIGVIATMDSLFPGQIATYELDTPLEPNTEIEFVGEIIVDPQNPTFIECEDGDNISEPATAFCGFG